MCDGAPGIDLWEIRCLAALVDGLDGRAFAAGTLEQVDAEFPAVGPVEDSDLVACKECKGYTVNILNPMQRTAVGHTTQVKVCAKGVAGTKRHHPRCLRRGTRDTSLI